MAFPLAAIGGSIWGFVKKIPDWMLWALAAVVLLKFVDMRAEQRGRVKQKEKNARQSAEDHAVHIETSSTIKEEIRNDRDRAIEAGNDLPSVAHTDELRERAPDIHSVLIRGDG